jgi:hypothetical protein
MFVFMAEQELISLYRQYNGSNISEEEWYCDIYSLLADLIQEYNASLSYDPGAAFRNAKKIKQRLRDLLKQDIDHLASFNPEFADVMNNVYVEEVAQKIPGASVMNSKDFQEFLILFNTPLLNFIHAFNANFELITERTVVDGYLEKYEEVARDARFSDTALIYKIMSDVKDFYVDYNVHPATSLDFYHEPYNVCERAKAARRFIIAHEVAHILLGHHKADISRRRLIESHPEFDYFLFRKKQEYEADALALDMVLKEFDKEALSDIEVYERENVINGIRLFFIGLEFVESFHDWHRVTPEYPHSSLRDMAIFNRSYKWLASRQPHSIKILESFTITKDLFRNLPYSSPSWVRGTFGTFWGLYRVEQQTDEEILASIDDEEYASYLIQNRGYYSVYEKYQLYNEQLFYTMSEEELEIYFTYHALLFGPEYARNKIVTQLSHVAALRQLEKQPDNQIAARVLKDTEEVEHPNSAFKREHKLLRAKQFQPSFFDNFEQRFNDCLVDGRIQYKEFRQLYEN